MRGEIFQAISSLIIQQMQLPYVPTFIAFDDGKFAITRKRSEWVAHFLETTYFLGSMLHNQPVNIASDVSTEFLLVRFAWAIFPLMKPFIEQGPERLVKLREKSSDGFFEVTKIIDPATFTQLAAAGRGRSKSPKKCKASDSNLSPVIEVKRLGHFNNDDSFDELLSQSSSQSTLSEEVITSTIRKEELYKRRPTYNPNLICCDYSFAELENAKGHPGKPEYGGGYLCLRCFGLEDL